MLLHSVLLSLAITLLIPARVVWAQAQERTIYASVVDRAGTPVTDLRASEFIVREDDTAREVLRVSTATEPMQIAVLIDTSQAIERHVLDLRKALVGFFKEVSGENDVALIGTGERPTVLVEYTRDLGRLEKAMGTVFARPGSGTYAMEAIIEASGALQRRKSARPHIVVITAAGPEFSEQHHDHVLESLRESGATLHTFVLTKPGVVRTERSDQEFDLAVADGTRLSGGRRDDLLTSMAFAERLHALANELKNQYQVTYARPQKLIPPKSIEVSSKRDGITVRARRWP